MDSCSNIILGDDLRGFMKLGQSAQLLLKDKKTLHDRCGRGALK